jgi:hypothetical protein
MRAQFDVDTTEVSHRPLHFAATQRAARSWLCALGVTALALGSTAHLGAAQPLEAPGFSNYLDVLLRPGLADCGQFGWVMDVAAAPGGGHFLAVGPITGYVDCRDRDGPAERPLTVAKLSAAGDLEWESSILSDRRLGQLRAVAATPDGGVVAVAAAALPNGPTFLPVGTVMRLDASGAVVWRRNYSFGLATLEFEFGDVLVAPDAIYVMGVGRPSLNDAPQPLLLKLDHSGSAIWAKSLRVPNRATYSSGKLSLHPSGGLALVQQMFRHDSSGSYALYYLQVARLDASGTVLWSRQISDVQPGAHEGGVSVAADGRIMVSYVGNAMGDTSSVRMFSGNGAALARFGVASGGTAFGAHLTGDNEVKVLYRGRWEWSPRMGIARFDTSGSFIDKTALNCGLDYFERYSAVHSWLPDGGGAVLVGSTRPEGSAISSPFVVRVDAEGLGSPVCDLPGPDYFELASDSTQLLTSGMSAESTPLFEHEDEMPAVAALAGTGPLCLPPPAPDLVVSPERLNFAQIPSGQCATKALTIANLGDLDVSLLAQEVEGDSAFSIVEDECSGLVIAADTSCDVSIAYCPLAQAAHQALWIAETNDPARPQLSAELRSVLEAVVTPSAGTNGSITPSAPQTVALGDTVSFTVAVETGFSAQVAGSCGGSLTGATYTTREILADCSVAASFVPLHYTVTATAGANGTLLPSGAQIVQHGHTIEFVVSPAAGYLATVGGSCGGVLDGDRYRSDPITSDCSVTASFETDRSVFADGFESPGVP